jgi:CBS domain-containing protein
MPQKLARDVMTADPACCTPHTTLDDVARMMLEYDCGEIPVINASDEIVGVITDRDIVCRVIAQGKNPVGYTADTCMTRPVITVGVDDPIERVVSVMEAHRIRRVPVRNEQGGCAGIIAQADVAQSAPPRTTGELVRKVSGGADA